MCRCVGVEVWRCVGVWVGGGVGGWGGGCVGVGVCGWGGGGGEGGLATVIERRKGQAQRVGDAGGR